MLLYRVSITFTSQENLDSSVSNFIACFMDIMTPFLKKIPKPGFKGTNKEVQKSCDKSWFDRHRKLLYLDYCHALTTFNQNKSSANHDNLNIKKKIYKIMNVKQNIGICPKKVTCYVS